MNAGPISPKIPLTPVNSTVGRGLVESQNSPKHSQTTDYGSENRRALAIIVSSSQTKLFYEFIRRHKETLKYYRITGSKGVMNIVQKVFQEDPKVVFGLTTASMSMGGAAQITAQLVTQDLGAIIV